MKRFLALIVLLAASALPASADMGYFIVKGNITVAGPYDDFVRCSRIANAYGLGYYCELKVY